MANAAELVILLTARDAASKVIDGLGKSLGGLGTAGKVGAAAVTSFATAGAALLAGIGASVQVATDFEHAMSAVGAVAGASGGELDQLSQLALDLGQNVKLAGISASDAASAMEQLASGGVSTGDILKGAAEGALLLASAGGINVAQAAEIAAAALNNFGLAGDKAGHIADIFAAASNSSAVTVGDLGESMKYIGPIANSMGLSVEEVTAALAELGDQGIKGSQAGTSLRSILSSLAKPSKQASGLIKELGLEFFDAGGKMKSLGGISGELHDKLAGLTDQQRANALVTLFGNEALSAATTLYGAGADGIKKYLDQVNVEGAAAENGAKRNDNLRGSFEQLKSAIETAQIVLGRAFIPMLRTLTDQAASAVSAAIPFIQAWGPRLVSALQSGIGAVAGFGKNVAGAVGAVVDAVGKLAGGQITFAQFIGGMQIFVATVLANLGQLAQRAAPYLAAFFSAIGSFIGAAAPQILAQMGLWAASFVDWIVTTAIPFLAPRLMAFLTAVTTWIAGTAIPAIGAAALGLAAALGGWITTTAIPYLRTNLPLWLAALATWITGTALPAIGTAMLGVATAFTGWLTTTAIPALQTTLPLWLAAVAAWVTGTAIPAIGTAVSGIGAAFGGWITTTAIPYLATNLPLWLAAISTWITGTALPAIGVALVSLGTAFGDWVATTAVPWVQANLPGWLAAIATWITGTAIPGVVAAVAGLGTALGDWITKDAIPFVTANMPAWKATILSWVDNAKTAVADASKALGSALSDWISDIAIPYVTANMPVWKSTILSWVDNTKTTIADASKGLSTALADWITDSATPKTQENMVGWVNAITAGMDNAQGSINSRGGALSDALSGWIAQIATPQTLASMATWLGVIEAALTGAWPLILVLVKPLADALWQWITNLATPQMVSALGDFFSQLDKILAEGAAAPLILMALVGKAIITGLWNGITGQWPEVASWLQGVGSRARDAVGDLGSALFGAGQAIIQGMISGVQSMAGALAGAAADAARSALQAAKDALGIHSPSTEFATVGMQSMAGLVEGVQSQKGNITSALVDVAGGIAQTLTSTLERLGVLTDTGAGSASGITKRFAANFAVALDTMAATASAAGDFLTQAQAYKSLILMAVSEIKAAQAALNTVNTGLSIPALQGGGDAAGQALGNGVAQGVRRALDSHSPSQVMAAIGTDVVAGLVQGISQGTPDAVKAAADAATAVAGAIGAIFDALQKAGTFVLPATWAGLYAVGKGLEAAINDFAIIAERVGVDGPAAAAVLGEAGGKIAGGLGAMADALTKAAAYVAPADWSGLYALDKAIERLVNDLAIVAERVGVDSATLAGQFADGAGKVAALVGTAADNLTKLGDFAAPSEAAIGNLVTAVGRLVKGIAAAAKGLTADGLTLAGQFADAGGKVVGIIGTAVSGFTALATFVAPASQSVDALLATVRYVVGRFGEMAGLLTGDATTQTDAFAKAAAAVLGAVKAGTEAFGGLADLVLPTEQQIGLLVESTRLVVQALGQAAANLGQDALDRANAFAAAASAVFAAIKSALDLGKQMQDATPFSLGWLNPLVGAMDEMLRQANGLLTQAQGLRALADSFASAMSGAAGSFQAGFAAVGNIGGAGLSGGGGTTIINNTYVTGNTLLAKDTSTQQMVAGIVTAQQGRTISYSAG